MENVSLSNLVGYAGAKARKYGNVTNSIALFKWPVAAYIMVKVTWLR